MKVIFFPSERRAFFAYTNSVRLGDAQILRIAQNWPRDYFVEASVFQYIDYPIHGFQDTFDSWPHGSFNRSCFFKSNERQLFSGPNLFAFKLVLFLTKNVSNPGLLLSVLSCLSKKRFRCVFIFRTSQLSSLSSFLLCRRRRNRFAYLEITSTSCVTSFGCVLYSLK